MEEAREAAANNLEAHLKGNVYVLQIGACDGSSFDPIYPFIQKYGWAGLLVEPLPDLFERLEDTHMVRLASGNISLANVAVVDEAQECKMLRVPVESIESGDLPDWVIGICESVAPPRLPPVCIVSVI
jgi:hypothetical protein